MIKAFWDLVKAMINATLLLVALCLFLGWQLFSSVGRLTDQLADTRESLAPIHQELRDLRADLGQVKAAIASVETNPPETDNPGTFDPELLDKLDALDQRIADTQLILTAKLDSMDQTAIAAAETFAASLVRGIAQLFSHLPRPEA